jgi:hypothetical protein
MRNNKKGYDESATEIHGYKTLSKKIPNIKLISKVLAMLSLSDVVYLSFIF